MTEKIYVVTDLGPGDGGKGGVVHKISIMKRAHTIIKVGGGQGSHGVCTANGERFAFSHWGCGTLEGVKTHISKKFIIIPEAVLNEADALRYQCGIHNVFDLLTVDERVLCATHYHGISSRLKEIALGKSPRGTIGTGVGEAFRDSENFPDLVIWAGDLSRPDIRDRIAAVREVTREKLAPIVQSDFLVEDREIAKKEISLLYDDKFLDFAVDRFQQAAKSIKVVDPDYLRREVFSQEEVAVVESSHGILTDQYHGFHPHTSAIRTLPRFTRRVLDDAGYDGKVVNIGITRAYQIRHGAGPMPTADSKMTENLLPGSHKEENRYQGKIRVGSLDLVLLRYAIEVCGGPDAFDGLAITWFDQVQKNGIWNICDRYRGTGDRKYFSSLGEVNVRRGVDLDQLNYQEDLGKQLLNCAPEITTHEIPLDADRDNLYSLCADVLRERLDVPVRMISFGPTERDKVCK
ncbi:adenylosuccinate synthetase [Patescibacteria group bacterium]